MWSRATLRHCRRGARCRSMRGWSPCCGARQRAWLGHADASITARIYAHSQDAVCVMPGRVWVQLWHRTVRLMGRSGELVSINPFDDDNGSFFVLVNDEETTPPTPALTRARSRCAA
jgi:hypothetical protein